MRHLCIIRARAGGAHRLIGAVIRAARGARLAAAEARAGAQCELSTLSLINSAAPLIHSARLPNLRRGRPVGLPEGGGLFVALPAARVSRRRATKTGRAQPAEEFNLGGGI